MAIASSCGIRTQKEQMQGQNTAVRLFSVKICIYIYISFLS
jgi:hypothetical protein